jgi:hypothetical protein
MSQIQQMMEAMRLKLSADVSDTPAARKQKLQSALKQCSTRLTVRCRAASGDTIPHADKARFFGTQQSTEKAVSELYTQFSSEVQKPLLAVQRQVSLLAAAMTSLGDKVVMLQAVRWLLLHAVTSVARHSAHTCRSPQEQAPHLAVEDLISACEAACAALGKSASPERVLAAQQPLRFALDCVLRASYEADAALRGARADAISTMPNGWPRELWKHAFGETIWSGPLSMMSDALLSYKGSAVDAARVEVRPQPRLALHTMHTSRTDVGLRANHPAGVLEPQAAGLWARRRRPHRCAGVAEDGIRQS